MDLMPYLALMAQKQASDLFMSVGAPPCIKIDGVTSALADTRLSTADVTAMAGYLRQLAHGEVAAQQWLLARAGDALDPPADWVAAADRDRTPAPPALP